MEFDATATNKAKLFDFCNGVVKTKDTQHKFCLLYDNSVVQDTLIGEAQIVTPASMGHIQTNSKCIMDTASSNSTQLDTSSN